MSFDKLGLSPEILQAIADVGYEQPTPIQEQAIPYVLMGRDLLGIAQTGTGKTASFTLPMIEILAQGRAKARMPRSLIIAPTRELAAQVAENFELYGKYHKLNMALLIGGSSMADQLKVLERGVDVLIATPGRLLDLFERGRILLTDVKVLVIDEADRMLDMGFIPDVERIVGLLPQIRQTLFFSATMPPEVKRLADKFLMNPREVKVARPATTGENIEQGLAVVPGRRKRDALIALLKHENVKNAFIFCNRKREVSALFKVLDKEGFSAVQLHGDIVQSVRMETLAKFKNGEAKFMVCSDVAARGLDISAVSHVFNYDVPTHPDDYVHRIGRTGRAGMTGHAYTLATPDEGKFVTAIESLIGNEIPRIEVPGTPTEALEAGDDKGRGRRRGRGKPEPKPESKPEAPVQAEEPAQAVETASEEPVSESAPEETKPRAKAADKPKRADRPKRSDRPKGEDKPKADSRRSGRSRRGNRPADEVEAMKHADDVIGFGDHVPAFLSPPKPKKKAAAKKKAPAKKKAAPKQKAASETPPETEAQAEG